MSAYQEHAAWLAALRVDTSLVEESDLLLRVDDPRVFRADLLARLSGRRGPADAARQYIEGLSFDRAVRCIDLEGDPVPRAEIEEHLRRAWAKFRAEWDRVAEGSSTEIEGLRRAGAEVASARQELDALKQKLAELPSWDSDDLIARLRGVDPDTCKAVTEQAAFVSFALDDVRRDLHRREHERLQGVMALKKTGDELVNELLAMSAMEPRAASKLPALQARLVEAVRTRDAELAGRVVEVLRRLRQGEEVATDEEPISSSSPPLAAGRSVPPSPLRNRGGVSFREAVLSRASQVELLPKVPATDRSQLTDADGNEVWAELLREWSPEHLDRLRARAGQLPRVEAIGALILVWARRALLDNKPERAYLFFLDALRWSMCADVSQRALDPYRDGAAWGLLFSITSMYGAEGDHVFEPAALDLRSRDLRDTFDRLDTWDLYTGVAEALFDLGSHAAPFFDRYLSSYVAGSRRAARALVVGAVERVAEGPTTTWELLVAVFQAVGERVGPVDEAVLSGERPRDLAEQRRWLRKRTDLLKGRLVELRETNSLADEALETLAEVEKRFDRAMRGDGEAPHVSLSVLTPEVAVSSPSRVVLQLGPQDLTRPGHLCVRVQARFKDRGVVTSEVSRIPWLATGREHEVPVAVWSNEPGLATFTVDLLELTDEGVPKAIPTKVSNLSFKFVEAYQRPENQYVLATPVQDASRIIGRDREIQLVLRTLRGGVQDNPVLVLGPRRMGKTTLLNAVCSTPEITGNYLPVRIDFENVPADEPLATFFLTRMMRTVRDRLDEVKVVVPIREDHVQANVHAAFVEFMDAVEHRLQARDRRLLLVVDELEKVVSAVRVNEGGQRYGLGEEVLATLRAVMQRARRTSFVLAGVTDVLRQYQSTYQSRLFQLAQEIEVSPLEPDSAKQLVQYASRGTLKWRPPAVDLVVRETACHPSLIQAICHHIFEDLSARSARHVAVIDVEEAIARVASKEHVFRHLTEALSDPTDRVITRAIAELQVDRSLRRSSARWVRPIEIFRELDRGNTPIDEERLRQRLDRLCRDAPSVLESNPRRPRDNFHIAAGFYARHLVERERGEQSRSRDEHGYGPRSPIK